MPTERRGFTMVELLASIGIIALSMAICLPAPTENAFAEGPVEDDGPVTVHIFSCSSDDVDAPVERLVREGLVGTEMNFCGLESLGEGRFEVAIWTPASRRSAENLVTLQETFRGRLSFGPSAEKFLASNDG